jgi:hypothetical protein
VGAERAVREDAAAAGERAAGRERARGIGLRDADAGGAGNVDHAKLKVAPHGLGGPARSTRDAKAL